MKNVSAQGETLPSIGGAMSHLRATLPPTVHSQAQYKQGADVLHIWDVYLDYGNSNRLQALTLTGL